MNTPGIFVLTRREQRAVVVIAIALAALVIAKHYRDESRHIIPTTSTSAEPSVAPFLREENPVETGD